MQTTAYNPDGTVTVSFSGDLAAEQAEAIAEIKVRTRERILAAGWPEWRQLNRIREGGAALAAMEAEIDPHRAASDVAEAAVLAAATPAEVWAVVF